MPASSLRYELSKAASRFPVDVRILNGSHLSFKYHAIKEGSALAIKDDNERTDFAEDTLMRYLDFAPPPE